MKNILAALALLLVPLSAAALPTTIAADYRLTVAGIVIGHVHEDFASTPDTYSIHSVTRAEGPLKLFLDDQISLESTGNVVASGLQPLAFAQRRASRPKDDIHATFDWARGIMRSSAGGKTKEVPLPGQAQDRISVMYQFMHLTPGPANATVSMYMSNGRKVELYTYRFVDEASIDTPAGRFDALHYERVLSKPDENRAQVWLAKDRFNFPVRVVFDDSHGLHIEQTLVTLVSH